MNDAAPQCLKVDKQLCFSIYRLSNALIRSYRPLLKTLDLTYLQYICDDGAVGASASDREGNW